jgi:23S rRNA (uracil1939-C5)-methyltransferase
MKVEIEKIGGLGDGVATHEGKRVIVPYSAPGDILEVEKTAENNKRILAKIRSVIQPSPQRIDPVCPHFQTCGGCSLQHISDSEYSELKRDILERTLSRAGFTTAEKPLLKTTGPRSRRRITVHCRNRRGAVACGFYEAGSKELVAVEACPQSDKELEELVLKLPELLGPLAIKDSISNIQLTLIDQGIDLTIHCGRHPDKDSQNRMRRWVDDQTAARVSYSYKGKINTVASLTSITASFSGIAAHYPPGGFLQATVVGQETLIDEALKATANSTSVADLYAGCGTYTLPLLKAGHRVASWEGDARAVATLKKSIHDFGWQSAGDVIHQDIYNQPVSGVVLRDFDAAIINPPRNGAEPQIAALKESGIPLLIMVSCFPRTLERDLKLLNLAGYELQKAIAIDQFFWTPHLECLVVLKRINSQD